MLHDREPASPEIEQAFDNAIGSLEGGALFALYGPRGVGEPTQPATTRGRSIRLPGPA